MIVAHEAFWFTCTICQQRWPGSQCAGKFTDANGELICRDCAGLLSFEGVVA